MLKIKTLLFVGVALCAMLAVPNAHADDTLFFGANYSLSIADGEVAHGLGAKFSAIGEYEKFNLFSSIGFVAGLSDRGDLITPDLRALGVTDVDTLAFTVPLRVGYPFLINATENLRIALIPSLAFDLLFFSSKFSQSLYSTTLAYDLSGWGYSLGISANLGVQHKIGKVYLWYGIDFALPFVTVVLLSGEYSGYSFGYSVSGSVTDAATITPADYFSITISPFICVGFKL